MRNIILQQADTADLSVCYKRDTMNIYIIFVLVTACTGQLTPDDQSWYNPGATIKGFFDEQINQINQMKSFFEEQRSRLESALNSSYEGAVKMKVSVNNYLEEQQKKIINDINNYMESVKQNGRKVVDSWSYLPSDETSARLDNPDMVLPVPAIITRHGYTCETHTVISEGYVLNIHRIPRSKSSTDVPSKTVLLQHGLFASSADWILNGPEKALAYALSETGYDVWMSNIRGNRYCRDHAWLKTDSKAYWNFSWHDVALHDIPAVIDYILKVKGADTKITYMGHSMGTTILFAMLTLRPEYNQILHAGFALAPVVFMSNIKSPLKSLAPITSNVAYMQMLYGSHEFIPKNSSLGRISSSCDVDTMDAVVCKNIIFYVCGYNQQQFNKTLLPVFLSHIGTGTSWKTAVHYAQEVIAGDKFQQFDYGANHNQRIYGSDTPPEYDLAKVTLPIKLFWAQNDLLSDEKDVMKLYDRLPSTTEIYMVPCPEFNHIDYLWAIDAPKLLNDKILEVLKRTESNGFSFDFGFKL